ncbi:winged helix-turn-helix domain-containing protein [Kribbella sp. NPDC059898]|uniref:winged helix-turn-helix domain-containing protein n=1 Tax=Kribbella sp. NPDC059898 TaxID=3346995 RepID=UPI0036621A9B
MLPIAAGPEDGPSETSLIVGVAATTAERVHLARLLGGADALLLVSNADQARAFFELTGTAPEIVTAHEPPQIKAVPEPIAELQLDVERRVVRWRDRELPLTRLEHDFLHCLVAEPGQVWTYQRLHHEVWGNEHLGHGSHIHSVVKRLRQKLASLGAAVTIHAVRGVGFNLLPA